MTKTHVIDGVTFVEVEREAKLGDKVLIVNAEKSFGMYRNGDIIEVQRIVYNGIENNSVRTLDGENDSGFIIKREYVVIEPIESEEIAVDTTQASPEVIDLLANLARRVTSLETQLRDTQRNLETTAEELANTRHRLMKYADRFAAVEDKVEMLTDDVVTLDSRSQVLNAINKYYAEGSR
jgi:hypothetical protein